MSSQPSASSTAEPIEDIKPRWAGTSAETCQKMIDHAKSRSPMVKFMLEKMEEVKYPTFLSATPSKDIA